MNFRAIDKAITSWMEQHGILLLRVALAIIFIWFGVLKLFPSMSPAEGLVARTVFWFDPSWFVPVLGVWETLIGICLLYRPLIRVGLGLMALQMIGTFLPLILLPEITWRYAPFAATLEGQYIIKNLVLIAAGIVVGGTVLHKRGARKK